jgi:hypothetical protein
MSETPAQLYLDLMKKTLTFSLWEDPGMPIETFCYKKRGINKIFAMSISRLARKMGDYQIIKRPQYGQEERKSGKIWPRYGETMIGLQRLDNIQFCIEQVIKNKIEGDLIETGVWRGGAVIFMQAVLSVYGETNRKVFVADSFAGLPKPDENQYPADKGDQHHIEEFLAVSEDEVKINFQKYNLLNENIVFLKGWFKDTLPDAPINRLAVLRIDGDMYESTMDALSCLYKKLSPGGFCIIDDYSLLGCKQATEDYRRMHAINDPIQPIDWTGIFWQKTA